LVQHFQPPRSAILDIDRDISRDSVIVAPPDPESRSEIPKDHWTHGGLVRAVPVMIVTGAADWD
jgi:hypothetical protein